MEELAAVMRSTGARKDAGKSGKRRWVSPPITVKLIYTNLSDTPILTIATHLSCRYQAEFRTEATEASDPDCWPGRRTLLKCKGEREVSYQNDLIRGKKKKVTASGLSGEYDTTSDSITLLQGYQGASGFLGISLQGSNNGLKMWLHTQHMEVYVWRN